MILNINDFILSLAYHEHEQQQHQQRHRCRPELRLLRPFFWAESSFRFAATGRRRCSLGSPMGSPVLTLRGGSFLVTLFSFPELVLMVVVVMVVLVLVVLLVLLIPPPPEVSWDSGFCFFDDPLSLSPFIDSFRPFSLSFVIFR